MPCLVVSCLDLGGGSWYLDGLNFASGWSTDTTDTTDTTDSAEMLTTVS